MRGGKTPIAEVIRLALETKGSEIRVCLPGYVKDFDPATQLATVVPGVSEIGRLEDGTEVVEERLPICHVPVVFPGGGGHSLTFPVKAGDEGLIHWCDNEIDKWLDAGGQVTPNSVRSHHTSDAIFVPGARSRPNAIAGFDPDHTTLGKDGSAADFVALAQKVLDQLNSIATTFNFHTHILTIAAQSGAGGTGTAAVPASSMSPATVASATVKVKG